MKRKSLLFMLLTVLLAPFAAQAQNELTVYDGTATSNTVPAYVYYFDDFTRSQFVIPADDLAAISTGSSISTLKFYTTSSYIPYTTDVDVDVYLMEVDYTTMSGLEPKDNGTIVYNGALEFVSEGEGGSLTIEFDAPYTYGGGNLLVGIENLAEGTYKNIYFYGQSVTGAAYSGSGSSLAGVYPYSRSFIPKTTITYSAGSGPVCDRPETMEASNVTSTSATLTWTGGSGTYNVEIKGGSYADWTPVPNMTNTTATTTTLTLAPGTAYQARVQSVCGEDVSGYKSVSFMTLFGIPLVEEFGTAIPTGWAQYTGLLADVLDGTVELAAATYGWNFGAGSNGVFDQHAYANIYGTSCQRWLVLPTLAMENNVELSFEVAYTAYSGTLTAPAQTGDDDKFVVLIYDGTNWNILRQWDNAGSQYVLNDLNTTPLIVKFDLSSYAGNNIAVAFYAESTAYNADNNIHIDNVIIDYIPACPKPTNLAVEYTGGTTANVTWDGNAAGYEIALNGTPLPDPITGNSYQLTGLALATTYEVTVRANCGADGYSEYTNPVSFSTDICMEEDQCLLYFVTIDSWGDGWNGAYIEVVDVETGITVGAISNEDQDGASQQEETNYWALSVCKDREIQFIWHAGNYDSECYFGVFDVNTNEIFESGAMTEPYNHMVDCTLTDCRKPSTPEVSNIGPRTAELSWTEYGPATEWVVAYMGPDDEDFIQLPATTENPYTLTGLEIGTEYIVKVLPVCDVDFWSEEVTFTTDSNPCPVPTALNANHVTATSANLTWEGFGETYNVSYGVLAHGEVLESIDFEDSSYGDWTSIDADGDGYDWVLGSLCGGIYLVEDATLAGNGHDESTADFITSGSYSNVTGVGALTPDNYFVSPQVALGGLFSFWACAQDAGYPAEKFGVAVSTTGNTNASDFTTIWSTTLTAKGGNDRGDAAMFVKKGNRVSPNTTRSGNRDQGVWYHYTIDLSAYSGNGYVAIRHFDCTDQFMLNVDDIVIEGPAQIEWTDLTGVTGNNVEITGLIPETEYYWKVMADCGADGTGSWGSASFTTGDVCETPHELEATDITHEAATLTWAGSQDSYNLEYRTAEEREEIYFNNFNGGATPLQTEGWAWEGYIIYGLEDPIYGYSDTENYFLQMGWATTEEAYIFSPELPAYESGAIVEFYPFYYNNENTFQIGYSTTTNDTTAFSWSEPITAGTADYDLKYSETLPDGVKYIAFKATAEDQNHCIFIDNFHIYRISEAAGEWIPVTANASTYTLTGLTEETKYEWHVQGVNAECDEIGWSEIADFTTTEITNLTQTIALTAGVNWVSFYVETNLNDLKAALQGTGLTNVTIQSKSNGSTTWNGRRWMGSVSSFNLTQMYIIKVPSDCEISLEAMPVVPAEHPITIVPGVNWIAFPLTVNMTLNNAFAGFSAPQDAVSSRTKSSTWNGRRWMGQLTTLEVGQGYIYNSKATENKTLVFPEN